MSEPDWDLRHVRHAHAVATRWLREGECLASCVPSTDDVRVALSRELGMAMPRERVQRLCEAEGLRLADAQAERTHGRRPRRSY